MRSGAARAPLFGSRFGMVVLLIASLTVVALFRIYPLALNIPLSLYETRLLGSKATFVGVSNFVQLFQDPEWGASLRTGILYSTGVVGLSTLLGLGVAAVLRKESWWSKALRVGFVLPAFVPGIAAAAVWRWCFDPFDGPVNHTLALFGIAGPYWIHDPAWALPSLVVIGVWRDLGIAMAIYLGALSHIPPEIEDAARIDGASRTALWRHVLVPLLRPATALIVGTGLLRSLDVFAPIYVMTGGGPMNATTTWGYYLFKVGFESRSAGYAAAMTVTVVSAVLGLLLLAVWRWRHRFAPAVEGVH